MQAAERGIVRSIRVVIRAIDAVEGWVKGYSKQDKLNNQRLASGNITPEDRIKFNLTNEAARIEALPDEKVDELIINQATLDLGLWVRPQQK